MAADLQILPMMESLEKQVTMSNTGLTEGVPNPAFLGDSDSSDSSITMGNRQCSTASSSPVSLSSASLSAKHGLLSISNSEDEETTADIQPNLMSIYGKKGSRAGEFIYPGSLLVAGDGRVFVVDVGNYRIQMFDSNGSFQKQLVWEDKNQEIGDIVLDESTESLLILKFFRTKYKEVKASYISKVSLSTLRETGYYPLEGRPSAMFMCLRSDGLIAASDHLTRQILLFTKDGKRAGEICLQSENVIPGKLVAGRDGHLLLGDTNSNRVVVINESGHLVRKIGGLRGQPDTIMKPSGVIYDAVSDRVLVADWLGDKVQMFQYDGGYLGNVMEGKGKMKRPHSLHLNPTGTLLISECTNHHVIAVSLSEFSA